MANKWSAQHYNALAKDIREELTTAVDFFPPSWDATVEKVRDNRLTYYAIEALVKLAIRLAKRFAEDDERFDPHKFLDVCSPDEQLYPLSELWEDG